MAPNRGLIDGVGEYSVGNNYMANDSLFATCRWNRSRGPRTICVRRPIASDRIYLPAHINDSRFFYEDLNSENYRFIVFFQE
jgi:hypothetical protein